MPCLYKFIEQKYLRGFFETGSLRLGTVYTFKDIVEYGIHRGDDEEGQHHVVRRNEGVVTLRRDVYHSILSEIFGMEEDGESWVRGGTFIVPRESPDYFIFCTSAFYTEALFGLWNKREKLDACYEIFDPQGFIRAISRGIASSTYFAFASDVVYTDKEIDFQTAEANLSPTITKQRNKYHWQQEHRMLWAPLLPSTPLRPWIIQVPEARRFCRPIALLRGSTFSYL